MYSVVVVYDIADDRRRADVSGALEKLGPRVQFSVFECQLPHKAAVDALIKELGTLVDPVEDQVRLYVLGRRPASPRIVGSRVLQEWRDFWIV